MRSLMEEYQEPMDLQISLQNENLEEESQNDLKEIVDYNSNITTLDPLYSSIKPLTSYIVRIFLREPKVTDEGILIPNKQYIDVPTQNGMGTLQQIESPFPYSNKAIIVAAPEIGSLKPGDIVQLNSNPIRPIPQGHGKNAVVVVPSAYIHPEAGSYEIPQKPSNKHYGYLILPSHEIIVKLS